MDKAVGTVDDPRAYLKARIAQVFDAGNAGRPRWTITDAHMVARLLKRAEHRTVSRKGAASR